MSGEGCFYLHVDPRNWKIRSTQHVKRNAAFSFVSQSSVPLYTTQETKEMNIRYVWVRYRKQRRFFHGTSSVRKYFINDVLQCCLLGLRGFEI